MIWSPQCVGGMAFPPVLPAISFRPTALRGHTVATAASSIPEVRLPDLFLQRLGESPKQEFFPRHLVNAAHWLVEAISQSTLSPTPLLAP